MTDLIYTKHASQRLNHRGRSKADVETVLQFGTPFDETSFVLLGKDVDREVQRLKQKIEQLERLCGWKVVVDGDVVITTYKPSRLRLPNRRRSQHH